MLMFYSYLLASLTGLEPVTHGLEDRCPIHLSYREMTNGGEGKIRTYETEVTDLQSVRFNRLHTSPNMDTQGYAPCLRN